MTSSLLMLEPAMDQVLVSLGNAADGTINFGKAQDVPTPLHALESALTGCIGLSLLSLVKTYNKGAVNTAITYSVRIGDSSIKIKCSCPLESRKIFREAVESCYLSKLINLDKEIEFLRAKESESREWK